MKKITAVFIVFLMILSCFAVGTTIAAQDQEQKNEQKMAGADKKVERVTEGLSDMEDFRGSLPKAGPPMEKIEAGPLEVILQPLRVPSLTFPPLGAGTTRYVPTDYPTIQQAINSASAGDTIYVYNGTYEENLNIPVNITLIGEGRDVTFIDGNGSDCITVTAADVEIMGFTIHNGAAGIYVEADEASVTVFNNNISANDYGGVQINATNGIVADITGNIISDNDCDCGDVLTGGGIRMYVNSSTGAIDATIKDNNIEYNLCGGIRIGWWSASQGSYGNASGPFASQQVCGDITAILDNNVISNNRDGSIRIKALDTIDATVTNNYIGCIEETSAGGLVRIGWVSYYDDNDPAQDYAYPAATVTAVVSGNTIECGDYSDSVSTGGMIRLMANDTLNATVNDNIMHGGDNIGGVIRIGHGGSSFYDGPPTPDVTATVINNTLDFYADYDDSEYPDIGGIIRIVAIDTLDATVNENFIVGGDNTGGVIRIGYGGWSYGDDYNRPATKYVTATVNGNYMNCGNASDNVNIGGFVRIVANETLNATVNDNYIRGGYYIGGVIRIGNFGYWYAPTKDVTATVNNNEIDLTDFDDLGGVIRIYAHDNIDATVNENDIYGNEDGGGNLEGGGIRIGWTGNEYYPYYPLGCVYPCKDVVATVNDNTIDPCNGGSIRIMANDTLDATVKNNLASGNYGSGIRVGYFCWNNEIDYYTPAVTATVINNIATDNYGSGIHVAARDSLTALIDRNNVSNNTYCDYSYSDYVANGSGLIVEGGSDVTITRNTFIGNALYGLYCNGTSPDVYFGNTFEDNTVGIRCENGANPTIYHNSFVNNADFGVENHDSSVTVDAEYNWWGNDTGPYNAVSNPTGTGDNVSEDVDYDPWLSAEGEDSETETVTDGYIDARYETNTTVVVTGTATVTVDEYPENPAGSPPSGFSAVGDYIDVYIGDASGVTQIEIRKYYTAEEIEGLTESALKLQWWNGAAWADCSDSGVNTGGNYVWAKIRDDTIPDLSYLEGGVFGTLGTTLPSRRGGGGGAPSDSDGDGYSDVQEMIAGTDPNDPDDYPGAPAVTPTPPPTVKPTVPPTVPATAPPTTPKPTPEAATPTPEEPGFEAIFAIAGFLAVAYLVLRLKK